MTKIYIIAGEPSGDYIVSCLMKSIRYLITQKNLNDYNNTLPKFIGVGGPLMQAEGLASLFNIDEISLMGFVEILPKFFRLKKLINMTARDVLKAAPALLVTIDSPGFTFRVAEIVRKLLPNLSMIHIVAPSVWAYKPGRALKYARIYDHMLTLLPFEPPYFTKVGMQASFVGHFILEQNFYSHNENLRKEFNFSKNDMILCITAGSRRNEIIMHMPIFAAALQIIQDKFPALKVIFVLSNLKYRDHISSYLKNLQLNFSFSVERLKIFAIADVALAKSGTNTLEIAVSETPMIVAYKLNILTFAILKLLVKVKYACLLNIVESREIIPEYIQSNCTPDKIAGAVMELLNDPQKRHNQIQMAKIALKNLGFNQNLKPSMKAAKIITDMLK